MLWKAPELLRNQSMNIRGTQKGDVYAFAIILYEIIGRKGPFGSTSNDPKGIYRRNNVTHKRIKGLDFHSDIVDLVKSPPADGESFRPNLDALYDSENVIEDYILQCMKDCWSENPEWRPDFPQIRTRLKKMKDGK